MSQEQNISSSADSGPSEPMASGEALADKIENMEVHKHPHHVTHKKKWTEYFLEFLMLFLAVFLGFIAENFREHQVEQNRENQYMQSFVYDLRNDTANLNFGFPRKDQRINAIDSIFLFFEVNRDVKILPGIVFRNIRRSTWDRLYWRNSTTIDQLKNAGGMRLIRKKNVADSIAAYDWQWQRAEYWKESYSIYQEKEEDLANKIFNAEDLISKYRKQSTFSLNPNITDTMKVRINPAPLNEYLNLLYRQKISTSQDKKAYQDIEQSAERLIKLIKKEYRLE